MDITSSFFDNIKDKTTNPFFGTLIFVWLVRNWDLVYTVFNFDSDCNLEDKKDFIRNYYVDKVVWQEIVMNISIALGLMVLSYSLIVVSRLVVNVTNHNIIPRMNEKTVSKLVVNKNRFETVKKTRDEYFVKIQDFEEQVITLEQKNSLSKKNNIENKQKIRELNETIEKINTIIEELENSQSNLQRSILENEKIIKEKEKDLALKDGVIKHYSHVNERLADDNGDFNDLIINYINDELQFYNLTPYDELKIPTKIKEAYLNLSRESREFKDLDTMFFDVASHLRYDDDKKDRTSFNGDLIKEYFKFGLVKFKSDVGENKNIDYKMGKYLELSVLGRIVLDTKGVYESLKLNDVI
jgi:hypothetical protein